MKHFVIFILIGAIQIKFIIINCLVKTEVTLGRSPVYQNGQNKTQKQSLGGKKDNLVN